MVPVYTLIKIKETVPQERTMVDRACVALLQLLPILAFVSLCAQFCSHRERSPSTPHTGVKGTSVKDCPSYQNERKHFATLNFILDIKPNNFDWKSLINKRGVFLVTPPFSVEFKTSQFDWKSLINERGVFLVTPQFYVDFQSRSI